MDNKKEIGTASPAGTPKNNGHSALAAEGMDAANAILARYGLSSEDKDGKIEPASSDSLFTDDTEEYEEEALSPEDENDIDEDIFEFDNASESNSEELVEDTDEAPGDALDEEDEDDPDGDVKIFGAESTGEKKEDDVPYTSERTDTRTFGKAQPEVGFSMFEDDDGEEQGTGSDEDVSLEPDDSVDGDNVYEAPNTADDAEPYIDEDDSDEPSVDSEIYEEGEITAEEDEYTEEDTYTEEDIAADEYAADEEADVEDVSPDEYEAAVVTENENDASGSEKQDALKALFYGTDDGGKDTRDSGKKKAKIIKKKPAQSGNDPWEKELSGSREIDMSDSKAVSAYTLTLEKKKAGAMISLAGAALCFLISMYLELAPISGILPHPSGLLRSNPAVYALIDLQIMFFGVMFMFESLAKGFEDWLDNRKVSPAFASLTVTAVAAAQALFTAFSAKGAESIRLLCSLGCASLVMLSLYDVLCASSTLRSFRIAALSSTKFGAVKLSENSREVDAITDGRQGVDMTAIDVRKGKVYKNFVKRTSSSPSCEKNLWIPMLVIFAVSVVIGLISGIGTKSVYHGFTNASLVYLSSVPLNLFICSALPEYIAIKRGRDINATMVGHNAGNEFRKLSYVTFADTTVFLPKDTRLESQIIVDSERFCDVTLTMVKIFRHIGGPLRYVFDRNLPNPDQEIPADVKLSAVTPTSIEVIVDGKNYVVGTEKHLTSMGLKFTRHDGDERYSLLYLIENGKVLAKFRIIYKVDSRFENTASELDDVHIAIGIKTVTPGINDAFLRSLDEFKYCDFTVIRGRGEADLYGVDAETDSGIIALGSVHKFLEMLLICENSVRRTWINSLVKNISAGFCVLIAAWLILFNNSPNLDIVFGLIIQLFWLIPVTLNSYLKK